jgi:hypothetical protein
LLLLLLLSSSSSSSGTHWIGWDLTYIVVVVVVIVVVVVVVVVIIIIIIIIIIKPVPVAERSEARTVFGRWNPGIVGSNPTRGMDVSAFFSVLCHVCR